MIVLIIVTINTLKRQYTNKIKHFQNNIKVLTEVCKKIVNEDKLFKTNRQLSRRI